MISKVITVGVKRLAGLYRNLMARGVLALQPELRMQLTRHIAANEPMKFKSYQYHALSKLSQGKGTTKDLLPTVSLERKYVANQYTKTADHMYVAQHKRVPMIDIDWPDKKNHRAIQVINKTKGEFMGKLDKYLESPRGRSSVFDLYETPAGLRAFDLGKRAGPIGYDDIARQLGSDRLYRFYSKHRGSFASRVSPKPGRQGDFVAQKFASNYGQGSVNPVSRMEVDKYHDGIIKRILDTDVPPTMDELTSLLDMAYPKGV